MSVVFIYLFAFEMNSDRCGAIPGIAPFDLIYFGLTKKEVNFISNTKTTKAISYKAKMGSKKLDSFFGKETSLVTEEKEEEKKKE